MNDRMFDSPVFVKSENSLIQEIACLEDALEFCMNGQSINAVRSTTPPFALASGPSTVITR